jgi:hypothetical protein
VVTRLHRVFGRRRRTRLAAGLAAAALLAALAWWLLAPRILATEYGAFPSPDRSYRVVVLRTPVWRGVMPGQAGDAPGVVRLYDRDGRVLRETRVAMVQPVERVEWSADSVWIKSVAEWALPEERSP